MRTILFLFVLLLFFSNSLIAQNSDDGITLQQCLDFAINNSYTTHKANLEISKANHQIDEARSKILPQINASGSFDHSIVLPTTMLPGELIGQSGTQIPVQMGLENPVSVAPSCQSKLTPCTKICLTLFAKIKMSPVGI